MATSGLATRCTACGTVFRVVPDQLRVSEGWVRCGRCAQVFNALESLADLDTGLPRREFGGADDDGFAASRLPPLEVAAPAPRPMAGAAAPPPTPVRPSDDDFLSTAAPDSEPPFAPAVIAHPDALAATATAPRPASPTPTGPGALAPSFLREAERAARWRRPGVRLGLAAGVLLAAALLAGQVAYTWRDQLASRVPALAPVLATACGWFGCTVGAARRIDALVVESSGLVRVERSNLYRLQVGLKNRADHAVAPPAIDLVLTDARGETLSRRVLSLAELGGPAGAVPAGRELALSATLETLAAGSASNATNERGNTAPRVIAGYTVELFYP